MPAFALEKTVAATTDTLSVDDVKQHLRIDTALDDLYIARLITAVRLYTEEYLGASLVPQTYRLSLPYFSSVVYIPVCPLTSITSIQYVDTAGDTQTLDSSKYVVDTRSKEGRIIPAYGEVWPSIRATLNPVTITFVAGYSLGECPEPIEQAMLLLIGHYYENRETTAPITINAVPMAYEFLLAPYRLPRF